MLRTEIIQYLLLPAFPRQPALYPQNAMPLIRLSVEPFQSRVVTDGLQTESLRKWHRAKGMQDGVWSRTERARGAKFRSLVTYMKLKPL